MAVIGQELRPSVTRLASRLVKNRRWGRRAAIRRHTQEDTAARIRSHAKDDQVIAVPSAAEASARVAHVGRRSAADLNLLELAAREEPDKTAVGRPEWERAALAAWNRSPGDPVERPQPQLVAILTAPDRHDIASIRRHRQLSRNAGAAAGQSAELHVVGWRQRGLDRAWCRRPPAAVACHDDWRRLIDTAKEVHP